ncbi:hypothetical protein [Aliiruegeria lutimaris]|uniref:Uncharacterized protein n=1 Tax=Aliiruegeria lutimaris TaxID=571298 RepID=A0A1G8P313_9RHOB|nr:hypothetical protein [Aliiruegeria lutimaris]SDI86901.1 hypothetical protein SAMN04488026_100857 [Aliiruegeria lutimaris]
MLNVITLAIIAISISLAAIALIREQRGNSSHGRAKSQSGRSVTFDPNAAQPAILSGFDLCSNALLLQLPAEQVAALVPTDFATRPITDGTGQDILYRNRVLLRLPHVSANRHVELHIEALAV